MKTKKIICLLLSLVLALSIATTAFADENWVGADGKMDPVSPTGSFWGYYLQGIRISVFDIVTKRVLATADYSNLSNDQIHNYETADGQTANIASNWFGYNSKLYYMKGGNLRFSRDTYSVRNFKGANGQKIYFPECINQDDTSNFEAVKDFFRDKVVVTSVATDFGMDYETLTNGDYKLILEPVVYFRYSGQWFAMTAAESGVWKLTRGSMGATDKTISMMKLTEGALPLCMFLEYDDNDVGIVAYTGGEVGGQPGAIIRDQMGVGILSAEDMTGDTEDKRICCDCDSFCPCKYDDNGKKIAGECRCFTDSRYSHEKKIPCTPDYPSNCLCQPGTLTIKKIDLKTRAPLAGAVFTVTNKMTGETKVKTTDANGTATFTLHIGTWIVTESSPPSGYIPTAHSINVDIAAGRKVTKTFTNEKDESKIDPPSGDNILWGYQLTKSFTNETNFQSKVNYPSNAAPSTTKCSGYSWYCEDARPPSGYTATGEARTHWHYKEVPDGVDEDGNPKTKWVKDYSDGYYEYCHNNGGFTAKHRTGYSWNTPNKEKPTTEPIIYVPKASYLSNESCADNSGMGRFKIMHNGVDGAYYKLEFNSPYNSGYTLYDRTTDLFKELTHKTWISHRNGGLTSRAKEIHLASYMSTTADNIAYKDFYTTYTGYTPHESSSYRSNSSDYNTHNNITTYTEHGGTMYRYFDGYYCNGGTTDDESHGAHAPTTSKWGQSVKTYVRQNYKYSVEGTYKAQARSVDSSKTNVTRTIYDNNTVKVTYQAPSNTFTFYPTYRMWYTSTLGVNDTSTAWMLSAGARSFKATDVLQISNSGGETDVWAPWSRDWVDKYTDDSVYGSEQSRDYSVIKSGMVVRAVSDAGATITIIAGFHVQDPNFAPSESVNAVKRANDAKAREMKALVESVVTQFTTNTAETYGYYSNLWEATSENIVTLSGGALDVPCPSWATSESPKTRLNIEDSFTPTTRYWYTAYRGSPDAYVGTVGDLSIAGKTYTRVSRVSSLDSYSGTTGTVASLLDTSFSGSRKNYLGTVANSNTDDSSFTRWYEEFYDGIVFCEIKAVITIPASKISTDYHQVHSQLSDSTTEMNAEATNLRAVGYNKTLFNDGMFGIGLCAITKSNIAFGGSDFGKAYLFWPAKEFGVRGSVYDLAQNATQEVIKLR